MKAVIEIFEALSSLLHEILFLNLTQNFFINIIFYIFTGPEEELPRKLEYFEFVCHAPSDYYKSRSAPYSTYPTEPETCFVWGRVGQPQIIPIEAGKDIIYK